MKEIVNDGTVKSRILTFLRSEGINNSEFSRRMGLSVAYLGAMRKSMPEEKLRKMLELFPNLNPTWLLYGEGPMLREVEEKAPQAVGSEPVGDYEVPLLPVEAFAGNLQMWSQGISLNECERFISPVKGADLAIRVSGDSMEPQIYGGTIILIKKINERAFIPWGNPLVIDTENGVLVKVVYPSEDNQTIEARSYNPLYPPIHIPAESIYGLYRVVASVRPISTM